MDPYRWSRFRPTLPGHREGSGGHVQRTEAYVAAHASTPEEAEALRRRIRSTRLIFFVSIVIGAFVAVAIYYVAAEPGPNSTLHRHLKHSDYKPLF